jgi:uncharacterized RmlC-like cupin family protein
MTQLLSDFEIHDFAFPEAVLGPQGQWLYPAVHDKIADIVALSSGVVRMAGHHAAKAHLHAESAITVYMPTNVYGIVSLVGPELLPIPHAPGSVIYIGAGIPHAGYNLGAAEVELFECRTDKSFNTDTMPLPDLEPLLAERIAKIRSDHAQGLLDAHLHQRTVHVLTSNGTTQ